METKKEAAASVNTTAEKITQLNYKNFNYKNQADIDKICQDIK